MKWDTLRDQDTGRIRLTYGDVITIDAIQSATSTEHINALPSGSEAVQSFKAYVAQSRSRETTWLVVADGRERSEIMSRRALGNVEPISEDDVWANVARNLSRQPEKELATDLLRAGAQGRISARCGRWRPRSSPSSSARPRAGKAPPCTAALAQRRASSDVAGKADRMREAATASRRRQRQTSSSA